MSKVANKAAKQAQPKVIALLSQKLINFGKLCLPWTKTRIGWLLLLLLFLLGFALGFWRSATLRRQNPAAAAAHMDAASSAAPRSSTALPKSTAAITQAEVQADKGVQPLPEVASIMQRQTVEFEAKLASVVRESSIAALKAVTPADFVRPCPGRVTETFGWKRNDSMGTWSLHAGVFLASPPGASIVSIASGQVARVEHNTLHGTLITIDHDSHWRSVYGYLSEVSIAAGDPVTVGQVIGKAGPGPEVADGLYFAVYKDGEPQDPQMLIPGL